MRTCSRSLAVALLASISAVAMPTLASPSPQASPAPADAPARTINASPESVEILERMGAYLAGLESYEIVAVTSRDEVVARGYKLQHNERTTLVFDKPGSLRAEVAGDLRNRTFVFANGQLVMYSPDDQAYVRIPAPGTVGDLVRTLLDAGVEMPLIDVLYQSAVGTLARDVRGGVLVGETVIDGTPCYHLAFRQAEADWQIWVEIGPRPLPRKIVITTRFEVGDPQFQTTLQWNLKPRITPSTFAFTPPAGSSEVSFGATGQ